MIKIAGEGVFPKATNDKIFPGDMNKLYAPHVISLYTGTGFDTSGSETDDHTIQLTASDIENYEYIVIELTLAVVNTTSAASASGSSRTTLQIETQETGGGGGGWTDLLATTLIGSAVHEAYAGDDNRHIFTVRFVKLLTSGEKSAGLDVKITAVSAVSGGSVAKLTNIQTVFEGRP